MAEFIEGKPQDEGGFIENDGELQENSADFKEPEFVALNDVEVADIQAHSEVGDEAADTTDVAPEAAFSNLRSFEKENIAEDIAIADEMTTETALNPDNDAIENDISQATAANESEHDSKIGQEGIPVAETETAEAAQILNSADTREQSLAATEDSPEEAAEINREAALQNTEDGRVENLEIDKAIEKLPHSASADQVSEALPPKGDIAAEAVAVNEDAASVQLGENSEDELPLGTDAAELSQKDGIPDEAASSMDASEESGEDLAGIYGAVSVGLNSTEAADLDTENGQDSEPESASTQPEISAAGEIEGIDEKRLEKQTTANGVAAEKDTDPQSEETLNTTAGKTNKKSTIKNSSGKKKNDTRSKNKPTARKVLGVFVGAILVVAVFFSGNILSALKIKFFKESTPSIESSAVIAVIPEKIQVVEEQSDADREIAAIKAGKDKLEVAFQEADTLREALLLKADEIIQLRQYYTDKINEIEQAVKAETQKVGIVDFSPAMKVKRIELNLRSIQRRQMYINKLEQPFNWVESGSEEILYLKRKALLDDQVAEIADGVDMKKHLRHINSAIQKYHPTADKLMIDTNSAETEPLETIWNRITAKNENVTTIFENEKDKLITEEICSGDLTRVTEITTLTTKGAECISKIPGTELFLNRISLITPSSAEHLFKWDGHWLCLNGVRKISPAVARALFQWQGEWISMNGLEELPPGLAKYLPSWGGRQLELMGLKLKNRKSAKDRIGFKYLARWEEAGGKLYIPDEIRQEMK